MLFALLINGVKSRTVKPLRLFGAAFLSKIRGAACRLAEGQAMPALAVFPDNYDSLLKLCARSREHKTGCFVRVEVVSGGTGG
ncbi:MULTISPECIES: hypothetical protein [Brucella]|uniref:Uncharacterized protein n=6 Tax=Brucella TaxID=234 RepID=Q8YC52_BRUME|nr:MULTISPECIES: hypothetical protein [Brucella]AAL53922.1 hypothetical protein BMEII0680 [Brucella melitensis bv. 1 str. 16M]ACU49710.1 hypothetical protein BMI_II582 [Brucella microti CCM 4915]AEK56067.1 hypothetical protein BPI_II640 [Brucella pinnipedialis B2/94]EEW81938.1 predicted protein [Brucella abortus NCTC 8038]EEX57339.1 predicted protein [Brucella abortus bv. 4 str. 292]EEX60561.1 predicted protein [Brucella abortus bv. 2 str. 86/8/59]EEX84507.1 predicted protein [Brucella abort